MKIHKFIILATILFFIFMDKKFNKYILNILIQIFGTFLKTEHGNPSKLGYVFYSIFYGLILLAILTFIDVSSIHLAF
jgi:hypothetical protein